jgi:hypothetical protein
MLSQLEFEIAAAESVDRWEQAHPNELEPETPLTCGQCDFYFPSRVDLGNGCCTLTEKAKRSSCLACPMIAVTCPF